MSVPSIRMAGAADRDAILALLDQAGLPTEDLATPDVAQFWVADDDGEIVGAVGLERHGATGLLRSLVVAPVARNRSLGNSLVATLERDATITGLEELVLLTQTARPFFERLGYEVVARESVPAAIKETSQFRVLCPGSSTCMRKALRNAVQPGATRAASRVLFLCTGNSCRSILGEATFNHLAPAGWHAMSAGSKPTGRVHPRSLALLRREGVATDDLYSKSWDDLAETPDIVITVCSSAAGETCPAYLGPALRTHWGVEDPASATGTDAEIDAAFVAAYRTLRRRIEAFLALPLAELSPDRAALKAAMDQIGTQVQ